MKKVVAVIIVILLLAGFGTPVFSGIMMERTVKQLFSQINQMYAEAGTDLTCELIDYDRSLFSSEIIWKINLGTLKTFYGTGDIVFVDRAEHGFTRFVSKTSLEKNQWYLDFVEQKLDGKHPLDIHTEYQYIGDIQTTITLDGFDWEKADEVFACMPGQLALTIDKNLRHFDSKGTWEGFSVADQFTVRQVSMDSQLEKFSTYIWDGHFAFSAENIQAENKKGRFELSNVKGEYSLDFEKEEKTLSVKAGFGVDSIMGAQNQIKDAFIQFGVNHIDSDAFEEFMELYSQITARIMSEWPEDSSKNPEKTKKDMQKRFAMLGLQMAGAYEKLLKQGLELQLSDLKATLPQGRINGNISLGLKKDMTLVQFAPLAVQPSLALDIFSLKSDFTLPVELVGENPKLLQPVFPGMQTGLFVKKGDNVIHHAETQNGKLFLNGRELRLP